MSRLFSQLRDAVLAACEVAVIVVMVPLIALGWVGHTVLGALYALGDLVLRRPWVLILLVAAATLGDLWCGWPGGMLLMLCVAGALLLVEVWRIDAGKS